jgi:probable HAF family extracellular repeat protein
MHKFQLARVALALSVAFGTSALHAQSSVRITHLVELGTLGSPTSFAYGINSFGQIVGDAFVSAGSPRGFIFEDSLRSVGTVAGYTASGAMAINDAGTAVGNVYSPATGFEARSYSEAAVFRGGGISLLGTLPAIDPNLDYGNGFVFRPESYATAINNAGLVAGFSNRGTDPQTAALSPHHAVTFSGGAAHDLGTLGGAASFARGINNLGQVVGYAQNGEGQFRAFVHANGSMSDITGAPSAAYAINDHGQVVGHYANAVQEQAFLYSNGAVRGLGRPGEAFSTGTGLNGLGQVVGYFRTNSNSPPVAFMFSEDVRYTLDSLASSFMANAQGTGFISLSRANGINDAGQIVGEGYFRSANGEIDVRAFAVQVKRLTFIWEGSEGFAFDNPNNWSDRFSPEGPDTVLLAELGSKCITLAGQTVRTDKLLALSGSDTTIDLGGGRWDVGAGASEADPQGRFRFTGGTVALSQGMLEVFDTVSLRNDGFANSVLRLNNGGILRASGNAMVVGASGGLFESVVEVNQNGTLILENTALLIGHQGLGSMRVSNGTVMVGPSLVVGVDAAGSLLAQGPGTTIAMPVDGGGPPPTAARSPAARDPGPRPTFGEVYVGLRQQGLVTIESGATLDLADALVQVGGERAGVDGILTVRGEGSLVRGGELRVLESGLMVVRDGGELVTHRGLTIQGGAVFFESSATSVAKEVFVNGGALNIDNSMLSTLKLDVFGGSVALTGNALLLVVAPQPEVVPGGEGSAQIAGGLLSIEAGSVLRAALVTLGQSARLIGRGVIDGTVINNGASIEPGESPGVLTIDGDFQQLDGSLVLEIGGTTVGTEHDQLRVSGDFALEGGVLELRFIDGFAPTTGEQYALLQVDGGLLNTGSFVVSGLLPGWQYSTAFDATSHSFMLTSLNDGVSAVPEPDAWLLMLGGIGLLAWRRRARQTAPGFQ